MKRQDVIQITYRSAFYMMALKMGADPSELDKTPDHGGKCLASTLRQRAIYLTVISLDVPLSQAARAAGVSKQAASKALRKIEDERDDPKLDCLLTQLETVLTGVPA